jgi:hypothetical protein
MCSVQALDTLKSHCTQRVIPIEQAKVVLVVLEQIRAEGTDRMRYVTDMIREEQNIVTTGELEEMSMADSTEDLE